MTDRRDTEEDLATLLSELEGTLTELRGALAEEPASPDGEPRRQRDHGGGSFPFRPPGMREILRFTEQQTIPTLIAILEANIRLLRLAGATLRAVDPERSAVETDDRSAASRALDAGGRLSADRLSSGLSELQEALSGTDSPNPEARRLLDDAETLSADVRARLQDGGPGREPQADSAEGGSSVSIDVEDASADEEADAAEEGGDTPDPDIDAELDSIREEVRADETADQSGGAEAEEEQGGGEAGEEQGGAETDEERGGAEAEEAQDGAEAEEKRNESERKDESRNEAGNADETDAEDDADTDA